MSWMFKTLDEYYCKGCSCIIDGCKQYKHNFDWNHKNIFDWFKIDYCGYHLCRECHKSKNTNEIQCKDCTCIIDGCKECKFKGKYCFKHKCRIVLKELKL